MGPLPAPDWLSLGLIDARRCTADGSLLLPLRRKERMPAEEEEGDVVAVAGRLAGVEEGEEAKKLIEPSPSSPSAAPFRLPLLPVPGRGGVRCSCFPGLNGSSAPSMICL